MKIQHKYWKAWNMRTLLLLLFIGLLYSVAAANTAVDDWPADIVEAFRASPIVQSEISRVRKRINSKESTQEDIKIIGLGGGCGVAGCGASYLAVITVHRRGVNPQSASVLATVHRSPRGVLGRVSVVELKEKGIGETKLEVQGENIRVNAPNIKSTVNFEDEGGRGVCQGRAPCHVRYELYMLEHFTM